MGKTRREKRGTTEVTAFNATRPAFNAHRLLWQRREKVDEDIGPKDTTTASTCGTASSTSSTSPTSSPIGLSANAMPYYPIGLSYVYISWCYVYMPRYYEYMPWCYYMCQAGVQAGYILARSVRNQPAVPT